jgi:hypothetical protein
MNARLLLIGVCAAVALGAALASITIAARMVASSKPEVDIAEECLAAFPDLHGMGGFVIVAAIEVVVPEHTATAEDQLSEMFFNQPEQNRFSDVTDVDWRRKWDALSMVLVEKAKRMSLDSVGLKRCLEALHCGRNESTIGCVYSMVPQGASREVREQLRRRDDEENARLLEEARREPGRHSEPVATVPVGAYVAQCAGRPCWVVVCKWAYEGTPEAPSRLGHVRVWALDAATGAFRAFVTCD